MDVWWRELVTQDRNEWILHVLLLWLGHKSFSESAILCLEVHSWSLIASHGWGNCLLSGKNWWFRIQNSRPFFIFSILLFRFPRMVYWYCFSPFWLTLVISLVINVSLRNLDMCLHLMYWFFDRNGRVKLKAYCITYLFSLSFVHEHVEFVCLTQVFL